MKRDGTLAQRLNVGCGPHHRLEGWWNVDIRDFAGVDEVHDVTTPWPWGRLNFVYAEHFLEHLAPLSAVDFLVSANAALAPEGRIRLSTPSLEWVLRSHFSFTADMDKTRQETFATNRAFHGWGHQFLYSKPMLDWFLRGVGFRDLRFFGYGESETAELRGIERHGGYVVRDGFPSVWIVEALGGDPNAAVDSLIVEEVRDQFVRYVEAGH